MTETDLVSEAAAADGAAELYRQIADTIPQMVWTARADGALDYVNARVVEYTGQPKQSHYGWGWKGVVHPEDQENCVAVWTRSLQSGERYEVEYRLRRADGAFRWHHGSALPLRSADGRVLHWFGVCTDIEDQVRSTQALEALVAERTRAFLDSEQRFQLFMDALPAPAWIRNADSRYAWVNQAFARIWGADEGNGVGMPAFRNLQPHEAQRYREIDEQVRAAGHPMQFLDRTPYGDWLKVKFPLVDNAGNVAIGGIALDVTDRSRLEHQLSAVEQRFRSFMENAPAVAWIKDSALRYTYVSSPYEKQVGKSARELIGHDDFEVWPEEVARLFRANDEEVIRSGTLKQAFEASTRPDGSRQQWLVIKFPLADASGKAGVAGMGIDITERVEAEEQVRRYAENVRSLMSRLVTAQESERRRVADNLHDLIGQNLTALGIELGALRRMLPGPSREAVAGRLDAMAGLVNDTVESIRGVMAELRPAALEEFGLVPALRAHASAFAERSGLRVSINVPNEVPRLAREAELALFRVAQEALTNAAKHSGGSSVDIAVTAAAGIVRLSVQDDGRGFADPVGARVARRGGYGLPEMRERAEAHGGKLRIEFPGRGTRLVAEIPLARGD
jgi:PAS domain S-box-containing protein